MWPSLRVSFPLFLISLLSLFTPCICKAENYSAIEPVVFNAPYSAKPGDIVGINGENFGAEPSVFLENSSDQSLQKLETLSTWDGKWVSVRIPSDVRGVLKIKVSNGAFFSSARALNAALPWHLDALQIVPSGKFRIFGRSLRQNGFTTEVLVNGLPATVQAEDSNEHMLTVIAPSVIKPNDKLSIKVNNGNGSGFHSLDRDISIGENGLDIFNTGVGWTGAFDSLVRKNSVLESVTSSGLCSGTGDDTSLIQAQIDRIGASGGGVIKLPAGICKIAGSLKLHSRLILQGAGKGVTFVQYSGNYPIWARGLDLIAIRNMTLQNKASNAESALIQSSTRVVIQNVRFEMNGGIQMYLNMNKNIVVDNCDFIQPKNSKNNGPLILSDNAGLSFTGNSIIFAHGSPSLANAHDAYIASNHVSRDMQDVQNSDDVVHSMAIDSAYRIAFIDNTFDVVNGPVINRVRNDGETLLTEGGGATRTERVGVVQGATANSVSDTAFHLPDTLRKLAVLPENLGIAIVSGKGAGQTRQILSINQGTILVDRPWDSIPENGSHYALAVWGLEKATIENNKLDSNPRGIWLYRTAVRDVDIVGNSIHNGGGILVSGAQNITNSQFASISQLRIADNNLSFDSGYWPPQICTSFVRMDSADFGVGTIGIEIRNNTIKTDKPDVKFPYEGVCPIQTITVRMATEGEGKDFGKNQVKVLGTVIQNNRCVGCNMPLLVREGTKATTLDSNR